MKAITIHAIDKQLADLIKSKTQSEGLRINKTVKKILKTSLGLEPSIKKKNGHDFKEFWGSWTKVDHDEFKEQTADLRKIDKWEWQ
jgi:hypothetical protein